MANHISPAAQLFRSMAELIDHDHTSHTDYDAITKAAEALAARASTDRLVAGPLWEVDGAGLLAAAYAFHADMPRQAATAAHIQALVETFPAPPQGGQPAPPGNPSAVTQGDPADRTTRPVPQQTNRLPRSTRGGCPDLPCTSWTRPMRPGCGRLCPSFAVARWHHAASSSA